MIYPTINIHEGCLFSKGEGSKDTAEDTRDGNNPALKITLVKPSSVSADKGRLT